MIDILVPLIEKDLPKFELSIQTYNKISDKIGDTYVVSPKSEKIQSFCKEHNLIYIEEGSYMGFTKDNLYIRKDRRGWLYQQFIKLKGNPGKNKDYLVIDSDVILLKKCSFVNNNIYNLHTSDQNWSIANKLVQRLIDIPIQQECFVTEKSIFNGDIIKNLQKNIEDRWGILWYDAIQRLYDNNSIIGFSEYQLYNNYLISNTSQYTIKHDNIIRLKYNNQNLSDLKNKYCIFSQITLYD